MCERQTANAFANAFAFVASLVLEADSLALALRRKATDSLLTVPQTGEAADLD